MHTKNQYAMLVFGHIRPKASSCRLVLMRKVTDVNDDGAMRTAEEVSICSQCGRSSLIVGLPLDIVVCS